MRNPFALVILLISLAPLSGWGGVRLIAWQSQPSAPRVVLPRLAEETPEQAVERYLQSIQTEPGLDSLRPPNFQAQKGFSKDLPAEAPAGSLRLALIANSFQDLRANGDRIQRNIRSFSKAGADPFVIGLSADLGLSDSDALEFRELISRNFSLLVALGGDDISPELYGESLRFSQNTNLVRDRSELALVSFYKKAARGIFFGICRGHQMGAVADGHSLNQDLTKAGTGTTSYHINSSGTNSSEMQTWHHIVFQDSLLARFLLGKIQADPQTTYTARVNSVHHQSVNPKASAASKVIALDDKDATVEALQGKNLKSFSVQFHPEFPAEFSGDPHFSSQGFQILQGIVSYARLNRIRGGALACGLVHSH